MYDRPFRDALGSNGRDGHGRQIELYKGRVDAAARESDVSWHGHHRGRSKWALGPTERIVCQRQRAAKAMTDPGSNPLVKALATDFSTTEARSAARDGLKAKLANSKPAEVKTKSIESLRQVSAVLGAKAPADAAAFKTWLRQISQATAEAAREGGGLLGIGGVKVSEAEKATLTEIDSALGV